MLLWWYFLNKWPSPGKHESLKRALNKIVSSVWPCCKGSPTLLNWLYGCKETSCWFFCFPALASSSNMMQEMHHMYENKRSSTTGHLGCEPIRHRVLSRSKVLVAGSFELPFLFKRTRAQRIIVNMRRVNMVGSGRQVGMHFLQTTFETLQHIPWLQLVIRLTKKPRNVKTAGKPDSLLTLCSCLYKAPCSLPKNWGVDGTSAKHQ